MTQLTDQAVEALNERMTAILGDSDAEYEMTTDSPTGLCRRILSGHVATEDMDEVMALLDEAADTMRAAWLATPNAASRHASVLAMAAQMVLFGTVLGKGLGDD